ncbi:MAG: hypothetical protein Q6364_12360 [Candidatus Hermodarchaeota archaeon]|nr:hypothetical protein [Candidatus Hermodarchaeota archaeon]
MNTKDNRWQCWFNRVRVIKRDWVFYSLAYIPFFMISFAVWICLDEAILALRYGIVIQWSLFPYFLLSHDAWHYIGIFLFLIGMVVLGIALLLNRNPVEEDQTQTEQIYWFQFFKQLRIWFHQTGVLVILGLSGVFCLATALGIMRYAYMAQNVCTTLGTSIPCFTNFFGIIIETLYIHQIGDVLVAIGLVLVFLVVISERSED